jgi:hypothetical protein
MQNKEIDALFSLYSELTVDGWSLCVHFAPPCRTFSRARDRSRRTRVRTSKFPAGTLPRSPDVVAANALARRISELASECAEAGLFVSIENPESSYMWLLPEFEIMKLAGWRDTTFSPCCYGAESAKPTRLRCWGWLPASLARRCSYSRALDAFTCGRTSSRPHVRLGFGAASTSAAAEYAPGVVTAWARDLQALDARVRAGGCVVELGDAPEERGKVRPHASRGVAADSTATLSAKRTVAAGQAFATRRRRWRA